jgi:hypothetical protein
MRRTVLALTIAAGLAIGTVLPAAALDTSITLNCSDGTSVKLLVDANTLTGLTQAVQAMIDYPAGLSCTIIQNPLGVTFGSIAFADSPGQNPFIVGGGRWQAPACGFTPRPDEDSQLARVPGAWSYWSDLRLGSSSTPQASWSAASADPGMMWVNIAVNVHQAVDGSFFGTLNETIPTQTVVCDSTTNNISEVHFTSKPSCLRTFSAPLSAVVTTQVTEVTPPSATFPGLTSNTIQFSFIDNGNPGDANPPDKLQGPPDFSTTTCQTTTAPSPLDTLANGNISVNKTTP